jgi:hypothetical protein
MIPMIGRKAEERQQRLPILDQALDGLVVFLGVYFSAKIAIAASAEARSDDNQMSRRSLCALGATTSGACRARSMSCAASIVKDGR